MSKSEYLQIEQGEWTRPTRRKFQDQCCDCGLVHTVDYRLVDGEIEFRVTRNERATAAVRRGFKFSNEDD